MRLLEVRIFCVQRNRSVDRIETVWSVRPVQEWFCSKVRADEAGPSGGSWAIPAPSRSEFFSSSQPLPYSASLPSKEARRSAITRSSTRAPPPLYRRWSDAQMLRALIFARAPRCYPQCKMCLRTISAGSFRSCVSTQTTAVQKESAGQKWCDRRRSHNSMPSWQRPAQAISSCARFRVAGNLIRLP